MAGRPRQNNPIDMTWSVWMPAKRGTDGSWALAVARPSGDLDPHSRFNFATLFDSIGRLRGLLEPNSHEQRALRLRWMSMTAVTVELHSRYTWFKKPADVEELPKAMEHMPEAPVETEPCFAHLEYARAKGEEGPQMVIWFSNQGGKLQHRKHRLETAPMRLGQFLWMLNPMG